MGRLLKACYSFAAEQSGEIASDIDGGGTVFPQLDGSGPIVNTRIPPCSIWLWRNHALSSGMPLSVADWM
jgi:hypothetical protein